MKKNNFPSAEIEKIEPTAIKATVGSLIELRGRGKPKDNEELRQTIVDYFRFCENSAIRPGVETLAMTCGVRRETIYKWSKGIGCDAERQEIIEDALAVIHCFIEQVFLAGRVNVAAGIFLLKNWCNYRDEISIADNMPHHEERRTLTVNELPRLGALKDAENE